MKNKLFQLYLYFNHVDRRYFQWAYFVLMLGTFLVQGMSDDGGSGTR